MNDVDSAENVSAGSAPGSCASRVLADRIEVPVFLAAGGEDERAPIEHSHRMERALRAAGVPVETLYYDTEGHGFYVDAHRVEFNERVLAFLGRHLGPGRKGGSSVDGASGAAP